MVEAAARYPGENQTDARLLLSMIYNRERRYHEALELLEDLQQRYPDNRLLWLEGGATALRSRDFGNARRQLDRGFAKLAKVPSPLVFGEEALWYYKRGASLLGLRRDAEAEADLRTALRSEGRDWVYARVHTELGKLADLSGDRNDACREYRAAVLMAKAADDSIGLADAESLLAAPYRP
jgi:tetratricopeptide (TPR) repeat protein